MRFLRKPVAADRVGYHPEHLMRLVRQGKFPAPVHLGPRTVAFVEDEVNAWLRARIAERDAGVANKRPQARLASTLVTRGGRLYMAFLAPGGAQEQRSPRFFSTRWSLV